MSIIVALKNDDKIYVGADKKIVCDDHIQYTSSKIKQMAYCETIVGVVGQLRDFNIIESLNIINQTTRPLNKIDMVSEIVPTLFDIYEMHGRISNDMGIRFFQSEFLFANDNRIFTVSMDGCVLEHEDYAVIGSGEELVGGYLSTVRDWSNPIHIIETAILMSCEKDVNVGSEIDMFIV